MSDPQVRQSRVEPAAEGRAVIKKSEGVVTLFKGSQPQCRRIEVTGGTIEDPNEEIGLEVTLDTITVDLDQGQEQEFEGKELTIRARSKTVNFKSSQC
jgi:hypothetical protein